MQVTLQGGQGTLTWTTSGLPTSTTFTTSNRTLASANITDAVGVYNAQFQVTDGTGVASNTITCPITISAPPTAGCSNINGLVGVASSTTLTASGGTAPLALAVTGLPTGLSFNSTTKVVSGTVNSVVSGSYTLTATDAAGSVATATCTYSIAPTPLLACPPSRIMDTTFAYSGTVVASGGTPPYTLSVLSGSVPGLSFNTSTGKFSGTPTTVGTPTVTFQVVDVNAGTFSVACQFTVTAPPTIGCPASFPTVSFCSVTLVVVTFLLNTRDTRSRCRSPSRPRR